MRQRATSPAPSRPLPAWQRRTLAAIALALVAGGLASTARGPAAAQVRDGGRGGAAGSGIVSGLVLTGSDPAVPLRYARVVLSGDTLQRPQVTISDADGRFRLDGIAPGHYSLSASRPGYVTMYAGATRPSRTGTGIDVTPGATADIVLRLSRGAVIAGTVTDATGEPRQGIQVRVLRLEFDPSTGRRRAVPVGEGGGRTDDLGAYRVFGLPAGQYVVQGRPAASDAAAGSAQYVSADEVRAALASVSRGLLQTRPGMPPAPPPLPPAPPERPAVGLAPIYFPGTPFLETATPIELAAAEERLGVDFDLAYLLEGAVSGTVSLPPDGIPPTVILWPGQDAIPTMGGPGLAVAADISGAFRFPAVAPGRYMLTADRLNGRSPAGPTWAAVPLTMYGADVEGIAVPLQPPIAIAGRIVLEGWHGPLPAGRVPLPISTGPDVFRRAGSLDVNADGTFTVSGLSAGPVRWPGRAGVRSPDRGWWLTSITGPSGDLLDSPLVLSHDLHDIVVHLSRNASAVSGRVRTADGRPASGLHVVLFPPEPSRWFFNAVRIAEARTSPTGTYTIRNLPAGDYLAAVSDDLEYNEWYDPQVLSRLASSARPVRISSDRTAIDLVWPGDPGR